MKLFTIGDSISQGFMSAAAARTDLSYSTLIARSMGLDDASYRYPDWPEGGHPVDVERLLRKLNRKYGSDIWGPIEWPLALATLGNMLDNTEDFYERGARAAHRPLPGGARYHHNVAVRGFDVADAWLVTPELCQQQIALPRDDGGDGFFKTPNASFYRTALDVLNPSRAPAFEQHSALQWLEDHSQDRHEKTGGVENVLLWLGANNALGTILFMEVKRTPSDPAEMRRDYATQPQREAFSLWAPAVFEDEYGELLDRVDKIMQGNKAKNWKVFLATIPAVSIAPLAKGVGEDIDMPDPFGIIKPMAKYSKYYTYFPFEAEAARKNQVPKLNLSEIYQIDEHIALYNQAIKKKVRALNKSNGSERYCVVDVCEVLLNAAYKRNRGMPPYVDNGMPKPIKELVPRPNTKFYFADRKSRMKDGGLFSLDGVHPSAIGQGIVAHEFMQVMQAQGVKMKRPLDWPAIIASDSLWSRPISLMQEVYQHDTLFKTLLRFIGKSGKGGGKSTM